MTLRIFNEKVFFFLISLISFTIVISPAPTDCNPSIINLENGWLNSFNITISLSCSEDAQTIEAGCGLFRREINYNPLLSYSSLSKFSGCPDKDGLIRIFFDIFDNEANKATHYVDVAVDTSLPDISVFPIQRQYVGEDSVDFVFFAQDKWSGLDLPSAEYCITDDGLCDTEWTTTGLKASSDCSQGTKKRCNFTISDWSGVDDKKYAISYRISDLAGHTRTLTDASTFNTEFGRANCEYSVNPYFANTFQPIEIKLVCSKNIEGETFGGRPVDVSDNILTFMASSGSQVGKKSINIYVDDGEDVNQEYIIEYFVDNEAPVCNLFTREFPGNDGVQTGEKVVFSMACTDSTEIFAIINLDNIVNDGSSLLPFSFNESSGLYEVPVILSSGVGDGLKTVSIDSIKDSLGNEVTELPTPVILIINNTGTPVATCGNEKCEPEKNECGICPECTLDDCKDDGQCSPPLENCKNALDCNCKNALCEPENYFATHTGCIVTGICGDGVCATDDECGVCYDCTLDDCLENGVCDVIHGENAETAPQDCLPFYVPPTPTPEPTITPTSTVTLMPTVTQITTIEPSLAPSIFPTVTPLISSIPSMSPSPTMDLSKNMSITPSVEPSISPAVEPTIVVTIAPTAVLPIDTEITPTIQTLITSVPTITLTTPPKSIPGVTKGIDCEDDDNPCTKVVKDSDGSCLKTILKGETCAKDLVCDGEGRCNICKCEESKKECIVGTCVEGACVREKLLCGTRCKTGVCNSQGDCVEKGKDGAICQCQSMCDKGFYCVNNVCQKTQCGDGNCQNECVTCPEDCDPVECDKNNICETGRGENCNTHPNDCRCQTGFYCSKNVTEGDGCERLVCGDGLCIEGAESPSLCCIDCPCPEKFVCDSILKVCMVETPTTQCGNGICDQGECSTCPDDCGCDSCPCKAEIQGDSEFNFLEGEKEEINFDLVNKGRISQFYKAILVDFDNNTLFEKEISLGSLSMYKLSIPLEIPKKKTEYLLLLNRRGDKNVITQTFVVAPRQKSFFEKYEIFFHLKEFFEIIFLIITALITLGGLAWRRKRKRVFVPPVPTSKPLQTMGGTYQQQQPQIRNSQQIPQNQQYQPSPPTQNMQQQQMTPQQGQNFYPQQTQQQNASFAQMVNKKKEL